MLVASCSSDETLAVETICFSFEERQCGGDPWLEESGINITDEQKATELRAFLDNQSIAIQGVEVRSNPNLITCQACFVCATGTTYLVEVDSIVRPQIESLDLLNVQEVPCNQ